MKQSSGGVQSVEVGMQVLKALAGIGDHASLNDIADAAKLPPPKAHRYLVSLVQSGMVSRTARGRYDLGPYVLELATGYLSRLDPTELATPVIDDLRQNTDEGIILSVWGQGGTTVIRWNQARRFISIGIRPGSQLSTLMTASGRIFLSFLPNSDTRASVQSEMGQPVGETGEYAPSDWSDIENIISETREQGLGRVEGHNVSYVSALAAPIFNYRGEVSMALALYGFKQDFDTSWDGKNAELVRRAAAEISAQLGYLEPGR